MIRLFPRSQPLVVALVAGALSALALGGGKPKTCHQCGHHKHVTQVCRLMKVCAAVDIPSYVYTKERVFYPEKGALRNTGYRSDTFYEFWRTCDCGKTNDPAQQATQRFLSELNCSSYTVCGCQTNYGAKSTGCDAGCSIRAPGKTARITTPILKWETVPLCKECCEKNGQAK